MQKEYVPPRSPVLFRFVKTLWILVTSVFFIYALLAYFTDGKMIPGNFYNKSAAMCEYSGSGAIRDTVSFNQGGIKVANDLKIALEEQYMRGCKEAIRFEIGPGNFMGILNAACLMQAKNEILSGASVKTGATNSGKRR